MTLVASPADRFSHSRLDEAWENHFEQGSFADVVLSVQGTEFRLIRAHLAVASPVFAALLTPQGGALWQEHHGQGPIVLHGVKSEVFTLIAKYAYRINVDLSADIVVSLRKAADMYQMAPLVEMCDDYMDLLLENIDVEIALGLLNSEIEATDAADNFGSYVADAGHAVFTCRKFSTLHAKTVEWILKSDIEANEEDVWRACRDWAFATASFHGIHWEDTLRPVLPYIRLSCLDPGTLSRDVLSSGLFTTGQELTTGHEGLAQSDCSCGATFVPAGFAATSVESHCCSCGASTNLKCVELGVQLHCSMSSTASSEPRAKYCLDHSTAPPDTSILGSDIVSFGRSDRHRCVFSQFGFDSGVHSWTIEWKIPGCCGYAGIATEEEMRKGSTNGGKDTRFLPLAPFAGFSQEGLVTVPKQAGSRVAITADMDNQVLTFQVAGGPPVSQRFSYRGRVHPVIESDEDSTFQIMRGVML